MIARNVHARAKGNICKIPAYLMAITILTVMTWYMTEDCYAGGMENSVTDIDNSRECSLTILYEDAAQNPAKGIKGAKFSICKVADVTVENQGAKYTLLKEFKTTGIRFDGMTAGASKTAARKLYREATDRGISMRHGTTGGDGKITFADLSPGIYLVAQKGEARAGGRIYTSEPFLALVPQPETAEGSEPCVWNYDTVARPKVAEVSKNPGPNPNPPPSSKTGDDTNLYIWGAAMILSALAIFILQSRRRKKEGKGG